MVGVNGTGKTTTAGKLSRLLVSEGKQVMLGAADTFRAAAADQLETWGAKVGVPVVRSDKDGADPASVAFEASAKAKEENADVLIIDTAGRLQNKANLMDELGKIRRVTEKNLPVDEVLLVLDATTGQNGMTQAKVFAEAIGITGVVLSKLDGSAKGGIVISVQKELGVPVKLVGLGEGPDDLAPFDPEASSTASSPDVPIFSGFAISVAKTSRHVPCVAGGFRIAITAQRQPHRQPQPPLPAPSGSSASAAAARPASPVK